MRSNAGKLQSFWLRTFPVAAAEGCVRLRSSRKSCNHGYTAAPDFTTAARSNAGFASCYGPRRSFNFPNQDGGDLYTGQIEVLKTKGKGQLISD
jgi:hypothetical protein